MLMGVLAVLSSERVARQNPCKAPRCVLRRGKAWIHGIFTQKAMMSLGSGSKTAFGSVSGRLIRTVTPSTSLMGRHGGGEQGEGRPDQTIPKYIVLRT